MYKLIAFDAYGTLFDVYSMSELAETLFPGHGKELALMWRDRQIEYTRLVTMSDPNPAGSKHYLLFWDLTIRSLRYVCKRMGINLTPVRLNDDSAQLAMLFLLPASLTDW